MTSTATPLLVNAFFEERLDRLFDLATRIETAFAAAGLDYRIVGGLATYLYVEEAEPDAGRLTKDVDIAVRREDLEKIARAAEAIGLTYRHVAGVDMLVQTGAPSARRAVRMIFAGEKVRAGYLEPTPELSTPRVIRNLRLAPVGDLVRMKLTSFRLKDQTHLKDLDEAGVITPEVEAALPPSLRARLAQVRSQE